VTAKRRHKRGWRQHYPTEMLYDVVMIMSIRPELPYQIILEAACERYGVEYRH